MQFLCLPLLEEFIHDSYMNLLIEINVLRNPLVLFFVSNLRIFPFCLQCWWVVFLFAVPEYFHFVCSVGGLFSCLQFQNISILFAVLVGCFLVCSSRIFPFCLQCWWVVFLFAGRCRRRWPQLLPQTNLFSNSWMGPI